MPSTNILAFPLRNYKPKLSELVSLDHAQHARRVNTIAIMRNDLLQAVHDALTSHGNDTDKAAIIVTAFALVINDLSKITASPLIMIGIEQELRLMRGKL